MQLISKVSFFYSADLRTRFARAANFPSHKKSITLLTCCKNNYYLWERIGVRTNEGNYLKHIYFLLINTERPCNKNEWSMFRNDNSVVAITRLDFD
jgi:hypothetical protein